MNSLAMRTICFALVMCLLPWFVPAKEAGAETKRDMRIVGSGISELPAGAYPLPEIFPREDHPRLLITKEDIPQIKAGLEKEQHGNAYELVKGFIATPTDGKLQDISGTNFDQNVLVNIESRAFDYIINGNEEAGAEAITAILNVLKTASFNPSQGDISRQMGQTIFIAAKVYDWCYPILTDKQANEIISGCIAIAVKMEPSWPPNQTSPIVGHGGEAMILRDLLSFAVAVYNEFPSFYDYIAGRLFAQFIEPRNYYLKSKSYNQGAYNTVRHTNDLWAQWIFYKCTGETIFVDECQYVAYQFLYYVRPDGNIFREGDVTTEVLGPVPTPYSANMRIAFLASGFYKDPYIKAEVARLSSQYKTFLYGFPSFTPVDFLILNDPDLEPRAIQELPNTMYFGSPNGLMLARTGWNFGLKAPDTVAFMKIGELYMTNHHQLDAGTFQIYYKGILANDRGVYDSYGTPLDKNWSKVTISHNGLLILDPNEALVDASENTGGQRMIPTIMSLDDMLSEKYQTGKVVGVEYGPDPVRPEYSYISGDITAAYTDKVSEVRRSMMFMPTDVPEAPAVFFVMDKIISKSASFKKTFLLHSLQEPEVNGNTTIIKRDTDGYNGKLTMQTLYPEDPKIEKIGGPGKQWYMNGTNYIPANIDAKTANENMNYGWGRVEISPSVKQKEDYFLNAMYVSDADEDIPVREASLIETNQLLGAKVINKVSLFAKDKERLSGRFTFRIESEEEMDIAITGLAKGEWTVSLNGSVLGKEIAGEEGGMIYFKGGGGNYTIALSDSSAIKPNPEVNLPELDVVTLMVDNRYMYSDVLPVVQNGRTLVPMRTLFESIGVEVEWNDEQRSAVVRDSVTELKITENSKIAWMNGEERELDVPAQIVDGRFLVPARFIAEEFGAKVTWDPFAKIVSVKMPYRSPNPNYIPIIDAVWSSHSVEEENGLMAFDGNIGTRWAASGDGEWMIMELNNTYTVKSFSTMFLNSAARTYTFDLYASMDGENFKQIFSGANTGAEGADTFELSQPVQAKYIKFVGHGNSVNAWNSLIEIEFYK